MSFTDSKSFTGIAVHAAAAGVVGGIASQQLLNRRDRVDFMGSGWNHAVLDGVLIGASSVVASSVQNSVVDGLSNMMQMGNTSKTMLHSYAKPAITGAGLVLGKQLTSNVAAARDSKLTDFALGAGSTAVADWGLTALTGRL